MCPLFLPALYKEKRRGCFVVVVQAWKTNRKEDWSNELKKERLWFFFFLFSFSPPHKVVHQSEVREFLLFASCNHLPVQFPLPFRQQCLTSADTAAYNVRGKIAKITFGKGLSVACLVKRRGWGANLHPLVQLLTCYWGCRTFFSFCCDSAVWPCCYW